MLALLPELTVGMRDAAVGLCPSLISPQHAAPSFWGEANAIATGRRLTPMTRDLKVLRRNNP